MQKLFTIFCALMLSVALSACDSGQPSSSNSQNNAGVKTNVAQKSTTQTAGAAQGTNAATAQEHPGNGAAAAQKATADLSPTQGNNVTGKVDFTEVSNSGVQVQATLTGLAPGKHGIHIHENGDCSAPDGSSAGGHFAPEGSAHGAPGDATHHVGDLGNITADDSGRASMNESFEFLSLSGQESVMGKAVIVHAGEDDLSSQPSGDAGARVACGVIKSASPGAAPAAGKEHPGESQTGSEHPGN